MYMHHYGLDNRLHVNKNISLFIHYFSRNGKFAEAFPANPAPYRNIWQQSDLKLVTLCGSWVSGDDRGASFNRDDLRQPRKLQC
jgi:hypothetical protein